MIKNRKKIFIFIEFYLVLLSNFYLKNSYNINE